MESTITIAKGDSNFKIDSDGTIVIGSEKIMINGVLVSDMEKEISNG